MTTNPPLDKGEDELRDSLRPYVCRSLMRPQPPSDDGTTDTAYEQLQQLEEARLEAVVRVFKAYAAKQHQPEPADSLVGHAFFNDSAQEHTEPLESCWCYKRLQSEHPPVAGEGELETGIRLIFFPSPIPTILGADAQLQLDKAMQLIRAYTHQAAERAALSASDEAFKEGQRVGQYQAADKLYRHVTAIYMFRDGDTKATAIAGTNATELLKDCEKYLNHNRKVYGAYVRGERYKRMHPKEQSAALQAKQKGDV